MTNLNNDFMESYKHLDKICKEIFNSEKGITTYINVMEEINDGNRYVPLWKESLYKLKHYRYVRNTYVHEVGTSQNDICTPDDIEWLNNFYKEIMQTTDPLAQYRRKKNLYRNKAVKSSKSIEKQGETRMQYQNIQDTQSQSDNCNNSGCLDGILKLFIIMGINLAVVLFIIFMIS